MSTTGVGLIGFGTSGEGFHAPLIVAEPSLQLRVIATRRAEAVARGRWGARVVESAEAVLSSPEVELVVIASPNDTHGALAEQALRAGKHVVVEKPFTLTLAEGERLAALAQEQGRCLTVFHNRRWDGDFLTVKQLLQSGRLGRLYTFESHFDRFRPEPKARWKEQEARGGGALYDLGSHLLDQAVELFGMPDSLQADLGRQRPGTQGVDYFHLVLRYGELRVLLHSGSVVSEPWPRFVLQGDKGGWIKYGLDPQEEQLKAGVRPGAEPWGLEPPERHGCLSTGERIPTCRGSYESFYRGVAQALAGVAPPPVTAQSATRVIRLIEAALASASEGRRVLLG